MTDGPTPEPKPKPEIVFEESLLSAASVVLFGRVVTDLTVGKPAVPAEQPPGRPSDLQEQLSDLDNSSPNFARIYGFSYGGVYYEVVHPSLFLVHGPGQDAELIKQPGPDTEDTPFYTDLKAWAYNQAEQTIRMDYEAGRFEQVLLNMIGDGAEPLHHNVSGAKVAGAKVSGAKVSGAKVSGAKVSGAKVSGARD